MLAGNYVVDYLRRLIASRAFSWPSILDDGLTAIQVYKICLVLNRLINVSRSTDYCMSTKLLVNKAALGNAMYTKS